MVMFSIIYIYMHTQYGATYPINSTGTKSIKVIAMAKEKIIDIAHIRYCSYRAR